MANRIFKQYAQGYGPNPVQVTVTLGGALIYSGTVFTVDEPLPALPNSNIRFDTPAWQWEEDADYEGSKSLEISVVGGTLLLAASFANNPKMVKTTPELEFLPYYTEIVDGVVFEDPLTDPAIDGTPLAGPYNPSYAGPWWWRIPTFTTFTATWHTNPVTALTPVTAQTQIADKSVTSGSPIEPFAPVSATGGYDPYAWSVSPNLPQGLSIGPGGVISGTPTASSASTVYTVTAKDNSILAQTSSQSFRLTVV